MNSDRQYDRTMELWRSYSIATSLELAAHLENFAILFSYNSGKIENREITYHDTHEIFKNGRVCGYTGDLRTLYEIKNLKDASELMYRWFDERKPITLDSIREMQFELTKGTYNERRWELGERPGEFKKNDLWGVGMHDVAAPVDEIEDDLQQDLDEVSEFGDENPLVAATFWHARFEGVHAFADLHAFSGRFALAAVFSVPSGRQFGDRCLRCSLTWHFPFFWILQFTEFILADWPLPKPS